MQLTVDSGQLPVNWKIKTLDELCHIARGGSPRPIKQFITNAPNGVNWIKISDASSSSKYIYETKEKITPNGIKHSRLVSEGDFILSNSMSFGRPYIMRTSGCIHDGWLVLKDKSGLFDQDYLYYFLGSSTTYKQFDILAAGSTVRNLNIDLVRGVKVTLPPPLEQKRIVAILDEAFEGIDRAIANTEKNLVNSRRLFESYLNAIFTQKGNGWVERKLGNLSEVQSGGTPLRSKPEYWGGQIAWYSSGELNELYTTAPERNITDKGLENSNAKLFLKGSLLIGMYDTAALKMSILDRKAAFNQAIAGVKPSDKIDLIFILHAINFVKPEILSLRRGVRQKNLSLQKIKDIVLAVPELQEQRRVVRQLASMREETQCLETIYRQKLTALKELKQSILQKAFTGELTADTANQITKAAQEVNAA